MNETASEGLECRISTLDLFKAAESTHNPMDEVGVYKGGVSTVVMSDLVGKMGKKDKKWAKGHRQRRYSRSHNHEMK